MNFTQTEDWNSECLQLLYKISNTINLSEDIDELLNNSLIQLVQKLSAQSALVRLINEEGTMTLASHHMIDKQAQHELQDTAIEGILFSRETEIADEVRLSESSSLLSGLPPVMLSVPIRHLVRTLGVLNIFFDTDQEIDEQCALMLVTLGQHIGQAIARHMHQESTVQKRVQSERNMLANELHDSLAQTLASVRLQMRVLDQSVQPSSDYETINMIEKIEHGLDQAYTELRQLIAYCHGPFEQRGLQSAIENIVNQFRKETDIHILLQCDQSLPDIPTNMEINAYRIVQEALSNIKKHSAAKIVRVLLDYDEGTYRILVENDGKGFNQYAIESKAGQHLGLTIMKERASHLGGELKIESEPDEGTRVELKFQYSQPEN